MGYNPQFTYCVIVAVLLPTFALPVYVAVTFVAPTGKVVTASFAEPFTREAVPSTCVPAIKFTLPVAKAVFDRTIAVNETDSPGDEGLTDDMSCSVVAAWVTTCVIAAEVLLLDVVSPL